ncbi:MAG: ATP-binding protein [Clostridiales bacterium]|nr:ATP-binding protein [Clostridiales bacterium]
MLISAIFLILIILCLIILYRTNGFAKVISMYFLAIAVNVIIGMIYLSKTMLAIIGKGMEFRIYALFNGIRLPLSTIVRVFNFSIFMFLIAAVLYVRYLYRLTWKKTVILLLPCIYMYITTDPYVFRMIYYMTVNDIVQNTYVWKRYMEFNDMFNKAVLAVYMAAPVLCALWKLRRTAIFVKRKDIIVSVICVVLINIFAYYSLFMGVFKDIMFYNVNEAKLPVNVQTNNHVYFSQIFLWLMIIMLMAIILIFRPFRVLEKSSGLMVFPRRGNQAKDMSMVLHAYKNAFLGVLQQFTLVQTYIEKGAYERAMNSAGIGKGIASEYMEMLTKTLSLLGKPNIKFKRTDLLYCINKAMQRVSLPSDGSIKLDLLTDTVDVPVYGDERYLIEVFVNLFVNSAEALKKKNNPDARIKVSVFQEEDLVQVTVIDNGIGVERKNLRRIFRPFFTTKSSTAGGVGLSYVWNVIRQHHGEIRVKGTENEYTEFQIVLPVYNYEGRKKHG